MSGEQYAQCLQNKPGRVAFCSHLTSQDGYQKLERDVDEAVNRGAVWRFAEQFALTQDPTGPLQTRLVSLIRQSRDYLNRGKITAGEHQELIQIQNRIRQKLGMSTARDTREAAALTENLAVAAGAMEQTVKRTTGMKIDLSAGPGHGSARAAQGMEKGRKAVDEAFSFPYKKALIAGGAVVGIIILILILK